MKLHLSNENKMLGGVCGGIAECIGTDPSFVRIGAVVLLLLLHGFTVLAYLLMWMLLPRE